MWYILAKALSQAATYGFHVQQCCSIVLLGCAACGEVEINIGGVIFQTSRLQASKPASGKLQSSHTCQVLNWHPVVQKWSRTH
eukprot:6234695-Amphidinium_carterae.1